MTLGCRRFRAVHLLVGSDGENPNEREHVRSYGRCGAVSANQELWTELHRNAICGGCPVTSVPRLKHGENILYGLEFLQNASPFDGISDFSIRFHWLGLDPGESPANPCFVPYPLHATALFPHQQVNRFSRDFCTLFPAQLGHSVIKGASCHDRARG